MVCPEVETISWSEEDDGKHVSFRPSRWNKNKNERVTIFNNYSLSLFFSFFLSFLLSYFFFTFQSLHYFVPEKTYWGQFLSIWEDILIFKNNFSISLFLWNSTVFDTYLYILLPSPFRLTFVLNLICLLTFFSVLYTFLSFFTLQYIKILNFFILGVSLFIFFFLLPMLWFCIIFSLVDQFATLQRSINNNNSLVYF